MIASTPALTPEIEAALEQYRFRPFRALLVSPLSEAKGQRLAYRVDSEDGQKVKVRQFASSAEARRVFELRLGLEEAFAPALARHGCVLIEEWVEGVPLTELDAERWAEEAGALLGRLHARRLGSDVPSTISTRKWREGAESDLGILLRAGRIASAGAGCLRAEIRQRDPAAACVALCHLDFCAENMLIDPGGKLRVIDNEMLAIRPAGFDLGRTFHGWPMSEWAWACFFRGYRSSAPGEPASIGFWRIVATLLGARVFLQRSPARLEATLAMLRRFTEGEDLSEPPPP